MSGQKKNDTETPSDADYNNGKKYLSEQKNVIAQLDSRINGSSFMDITLAKSSKRKYIYFFLFKF
jgi:hypothetical protein